MAGLSTNTRDSWSSLWIFCRHARGKIWWVDGQSNRAEKESAVKSKYSFDIRVDESPAIDMNAWAESFPL